MPTTIGAMATALVFSLGLVGLDALGVAHDLRGGISVALALSLPPGPQRNIVVALNYGLVVFSILVQGLSIAAVTRRTVAHR